MLASYFDEYTVSTDKHIDTGHSVHGHELKTAYEANAGFSMDVNASFSWRWARITTPCWGFYPQFGIYPTRRPAHRQGSKGGLYVWVRTGDKYRFYTSLMQGQFRDSIVKFSSDGVEQLLAQIWLGATREFADNIRGSFFYRASTREFKGPNAHDPVWAGLVISRAC